MQRRSRRSKTPSSTSRTRSPKLDPLNKKEYRNPKLLEQALTHPSVSPHFSKNNQRLEFLGDAILGLVVADLLYHAFPTFREGELAKLKSYLCSQKVLAAKALDLKIDQAILLAEGEEKSGGREKASILADAFEAVIGAFYLDKGFAQVKAFLENLFEPELPSLLKLEAMDDFKSLFQEKVQKKFNVLPKYTVKKKVGPAHSPTFYVECLVNGEVYGTGKGKSRKEAEQEAAKEALKKI